MILLARHGETADNRERRFQGQGPVPLNALGREQAAELAQVVVAHDPPIASLFASPVPRAAETAGIVAAAIGLEPVFDPRFAETDTGDWTGLMMDDVAREDPEGWAAYHRGVIRVALCHRDGPYPASLERFHDITVPNGSLVTL